MANDWLHFKRVLTTPEIHARCESPDTVISCPVGRIFFACYRETETARYGVVLSGACGVSRT
ncbi:hypothetical protein QCE80_17335, partial [Staphylococcus aureus]|nr:hypothetical protein [Staphylococcus aureus]